VVFGGSPERVTCTLVDGEIRYNREEFEWRGLTDAATHARARLLAQPPSSVSTSPHT
jgi:hypothetical protein